MTTKELETLRILLSKFRAWDTSDYSLRGRKIDKALAKDLRAALSAYRPDHPEASVMRARAKAILNDARYDLGCDLSGHSAVDLLLDNIPELRSVHEARALLEAVEERS